jgi:hypothetical protein
VHLLYRTRICIQDTSNTPSPMNLRVIQSPVFRMNAVTKSQSCCCSTESFLSFFTYHLFPWWWVFCPKLTFRLDPIRQSNSNQNSFWPTGLMYSLFISSSWCKIKPLSSWLDESNLLRPYKSKKSLLFLSKMV